MNILKRSQKFCPTCQEKNPIRSFKCWKCEYYFPQKPRPEKKPQPTTLEKFLIKKKEAESQRIVKIKEGAFIESEEYDTKSYALFTDYITTGKNKNQISHTPNIHIIPTCNIIIPKWDNTSQLTLSLSNLDLCKNYCYDFSSVNGNLIFGTIIYLNSETNEIIFSCIEALAKVDEENKNEPCIAMSSQQSFLIEVVKLNTMCLSFTTQILKHTSIFSLSIDNAYILLLYANSHIYVISSLNISENILKTDIMIGRDNIINILICDSNNKIFFCRYSIHLKDCAKSIEIISIFERQFQGRITDMQFLPLSDSYKVFFCCTSRDGYMKIFDTSNTENIIFKYKTTQTWITKFDYDKINNILFLLPNIDDKIVGIKLNAKKEPIVKRIYRSENAISLRINDFDEKLYFLNTRGEYYMIATYLIEDMFKTYKSKVKKEYQPQIFYNSKENEKESKFTRNFLIMNVLSSNNIFKIFILPCLDEITIKLLNENQ